MAGGRLPKGIAAAATSHASSAAAVVGAAAGNPLPEGLPGVITSTSVGQSADVMRFKREWDGSALETMAKVAAS